LRIFAILQEQEGTSLWMLPCGAAERGRKLVFEVHANSINNQPQDGCRTSGLVR
jgi:hypothetical protein